MPVPIYPSPNIPIGNTNAFAVGTAKGENALLECPVGQNITRIDVLTRVIDDCGTASDESTSLNKYVNAIGQNSYNLCPTKLLEQAGIDYKFSIKPGAYPTQVVYGYYNCGNLLRG